MKRDRLIAIITVFFLLGVLMPGCEYWTKHNIIGPDNPDNGDGGAGPTVFYLSDIQTIFNAKCINCHGNQGGLSLISYTTLMAGGNSGPAVSPGSAANSLLVKRIEGTIPPQMPLGASPLSESEINLIRTWINEGALNN